MIKQLMTVVLALAATGCAAPATPGAAALVQAGSPAQAPARRLMAAAGETVNQTSASGASLVRYWGFEPVSEHVDRTRTVRVQKEVELYSNKTGLYFTEMQMATERLPDLATAEFRYTGDGELTYVGGSRYAYRAPKDRLLVLNQVQGAFTMNGVRMTGITDMADYNADQRAVNQPTPIDVIVAPGELAVLTIGKGSVISGYTCDPAMRGLAGAAPAAGAK